MIPIRSFRYFQEPTRRLSLYQSSCRTGCQGIWADDTPDGKQSMAVWRRELGLRVRPARKSNMRRLSYEWLAGLREIVIDPVRCPLAYEELRLKEFERDRDGSWVDEIPDGSDHCIDAVRYAMMNDVLRGA